MPRLAGWLLALPVLSALAFTATRGCALQAHIPAQPMVLTEDADGEVSDIDERPLRTIIEPPGQASPIGANGIIEPTPLDSTRSETPTPMATNKQQSNAQGTLCVAGKQNDCIGRKKHWTGAMCCVEDVAICTTGKGFPSFYPGKGKGINGYGAGGYCGSDRKTHWTGTMCCVEDATICTTGIGNYCGNGDRKEHWTGTVCCTEDVTTCVPGRGISCGNGDRKEHWTGAMCCVEGVATCTVGPPSTGPQFRPPTLPPRKGPLLSAEPASCQGLEKHWTGEQCCF